MIVLMPVPGNRFVDEQCVKVGGLLERTEYEPTVNNHFR